METSAPRSDGRSASKLLYRTDTKKSLEIASHLKRVCLFLLLSSLILWSYISNIHSILFIIILYAHNIGRWRHDSLGCENIVTTTYLHTHRIIFIKKKHIFRKFLLSLYFSSPFSLPFVFHLILTWPVQAVLYFVLNYLSLELVSSNFWVKKIDCSVRISVCYLALWEPIAPRSNGFSLVFPGVALDMLPSSSKNLTRKLFQFFFAASHSWPTIYVHTYSKFGGWNLCLNLIKLIGHIWNIFLFWLKKRDCSRLIPD